MVGTMNNLKSKIYAAQLGLSIVLIEKTEVGEVVVNATVFSIIMGNVIAHKDRMAKGQKIGLKYYNCWNREWK